MLLKGVKDVGMNMEKSSMLGSNAESVAYHNCVKRGAKKARKTGLVCFGEFYATVAKYQDIQIKRR